jgi:hypothetical protein
MQAVLKAQINKPIAMTRAASLQMNAGRNVPPGACEDATQRMLLTHRELL